MGASNNHLYHIWQLERDSSWSDWDDIGMLSPSSGFASQPYIILDVHGWWQAFAVSVHLSVCPLVCLSALLSVFLQPLGRHLLTKCSLSLSPPLRPVLPSLIFFVPTSPLHPVLPPPLLRPILSSSSRPPLCLSADPPQLNSSGQLSRYVQNPLKFVLSKDSVAFNQSVTVSWAIPTDEATHKDWIGMLFVGRVV